MLFRSGARAPLSRVELLSGAREPWNHKAEALWQELRLWREAAATLSATSSSALMRPWWGGGWLRAGKHEGGARTHICARTHFTVALARSASERAGQTLAGGEGERGGEGGVGGREGRLCWGD